MCHGSCSSICSIISCDMVIMIWQSEGKILQFIKDYLINECFSYLAEE
jgi:hypothetical protein